MTATDTSAAGYLTTVNSRGEVEDIVFLDNTTITAMADAMTANERYRATMAQLKEARRYRRRVRRSEQDG